MIKHYQVRLGIPVTTSTTSLKLAPELKARVQRLAQARQRSSHWLMLEAVEQYVDREERREASRVAASRAWEDYQRTGLHVTAAEADAWMARLESGKDADTPECHARGRWYRQWATGLFAPEPGAA